MERNTIFEWEDVDIDGPFNLSEVIDGSGGSASTKESSVCSSKPVISLKRGKRTYFENDYTKNNNNRKISSSVLECGKKVKLSCQSARISRCQVEGCNLDLSSAKEYHRRHSLCESHFKCPKVIVGGVESRFCQKCGRFHSMSEFDGGKRSCRKTLSYHNARRRKSQQDPICFNSTSPFSSFDGAESIDVLSHPTGDPFSNVLNMSTYPHTSKGARAEIFDQGVKESVSSNADDIQGALSLLSNRKWGSYELNHYTMVQPGIHMGPQGSPLSSQEYWEPNLQSIDPHNKIFKSAYKNSFLF